MPIDSYEPDAQTVAFAGYSFDYLDNDKDSLTTRTDRTCFLKFSYV
jgi:hypothetical protein